MNKRLFPVVVALFAASLASAMDLTLANGQVLRDIHFVRQDAATVTFRHAAGLTQIEKRKLPPALLAQYPLDEAQAKLEAERQQQEAAAREAEAQRVAAERLQTAAAAEPVAPPPVEATPTPPVVAPTPVFESDFESEQWRDAYARNQFRYERMRRERRLYEYSRDSYRRHRHREDPPAPAPAWAPTSRMTPDVHMTPDVQMTPDINDTTTAPPTDESADIPAPHCPRRERSD